MDLDNSSLIFFFYSAIFLQVLYTCVFVRVYFYSVIKDFANYY